jgi:hypothetical protein
MRLTGSRHSDGGDPTDSLGLTTSFESERIPKQEPTVQVTADSTTMYKIIAREPFGVATQETLATARVKLLHTFLLSGGSNGRLIKGDELIEIEFRRGAASAAAFLPSESMSP